MYFIYLRYVGVYAYDFKSFIIHLQNGSYKNLENLILVQQNGRLVWDKWLRLREAQLDKYSKYVRCDTIQGKGEGREPDRWKKEEGNVNLKLKTSSQIYL